MLPPPWDNQAVSIELEFQGPQHETQGLSPGLARATSPGVARHCAILRAFACLFVPPPVTAIPQVRVPPHPRRDPATTLRNRTHSRQSESKGLSRGRTQTLTETLATDKSLDNQTPDATLY